MENAHFVLGFFIPIALAGALGYLFGRYHERMKWDDLIDRGVLPAPNEQDATVFAVIQEYDQVKVKDKKGFHYAILRRTPSNFVFDDLAVGDKLRITVQQNSIVTFASKP